MAISFACPFCKKLYKVKDELAGKRAACTGCKKVMTVPKPAPAPSPAESQAVEALAAAALVESPLPPHEVVAGTNIPLECPFCFENVTFPAERAGKQAPCPQCRRLIKVPVPAQAKPRENWRAAEHNFTLARKVDQINPEGAWGNAQLNQSVVSREALLEAEVILDRKALAAPDRTKLYYTLGTLLFLGIIGGWWFWRGKAADERRMGLIADAVNAADPKTTKLPPGWPAAALCAAGEFYLNESPPDLTNAKRHFQKARDAAGKVDNPTDKAGLLTAIALGQAGMVGDDDAIKANKALAWEDAHKELRQTLQRFQELPREDAWLVIEALTRKLQTRGSREPLIVAVAPTAFPAESDRAEALACVAMTLKTLGMDEADAIADQALKAYAGEGPPPVRLVAMLIGRKQMTEAQRILPDTARENPAHRLAYAEGLGRLGEPADLERGRKLATAPGPAEHTTAAYTLFAVAAADGGHPEELEPAVKFVADLATRNALPPWVLQRLAEACVRAEQPGLANQLADAGKQPAAKPWLELAALQAELAKSTAPAQEAAVEPMGANTPAQALGWIVLGRHNTKVSGGDARAAIEAWQADYARPLGFAGAALGLQDRAR